MAVSVGTALPRLSREQLELERLELDLLLDGVFRRYGLDFREYAPESLRRRARRRVREEGLRSISGLTERVLHDEACLQRLVRDLSISVTSMFRDPPFYRAFAEHVVPALRTYPFTRVWIAGCASGEEVYSLAILLLEHGLYERTRIYATDLNADLLEKAKAGAYRLDRMLEYAADYERAGGRRRLADYYRTRDGSAVLDRALGENVTWAQHNLVQDRSFNEFNVILCRNVLIYFDRPLQRRVHLLLDESLARLGVLALGSRESLRFSELEDRYDQLHAEGRIYLKVRAR